MSTMLSLPRAWCLKKGMKKETKEFAETLGNARRILIKGCVLSDLALVPLDLFLAGSLTEEPPNPCFLCA